MSKWLGGVDGREGWGHVQVFIKIAVVGNGALELVDIGCDNFIGRFGDHAGGLAAPGVD